MQRQQHTSAHVSIRQRTRMLTENVGVGGRCSASSPLPFPCDNPFPAAPPRRPPPAPPAPTLPPPPAPDSGASSPPPPPRIEASEEEEEDLEMLERPWHCSEETLPPPTESVTPPLPTPFSNSGTSTPVWCGDRCMGDWGWCDGAKGKPPTNVVVCSL
jgi:hypothetical protein